MPHSATVPTPPTTKQAREERGVRPTTDRHVAQSLEDHRLAQRVEHAMRATGYGPLRAVVISVSARVVELHGFVPTYYLKQIAQETALAVPGTHQIHNGLDVVPPS